MIKPFTRWSVVACLLFLVACPAPPPPAPPPAPAPAPPPAKRPPLPDRPELQLKWLVDMDKCDSLTVAPWGDVIVLGWSELTILAGDSGDVRGVTKLEGGKALSSAGVGFVDGTTLAIADSSGVWTIEFPAKRQEEVVSFSEWASVAAHSGVLMAFAWDSGTLKVYRLPAGDEVASFENVEARALEFSPDGRQLAVGGKSGISLIDLESKAITPLDLPDPELSKTDKKYKLTADVRTLAFSPDGALFFWRDRVRQVSEFNLKKGAVTHSFKAGSSRISLLPFKEGWLLTGEGKGLLLTHANLKKPQAVLFEGSTDLGDPTFATSAEGAVLCVGGTGKVALFALDPEWKAPPPGFDLAELAAPAAKRTKLDEMKQSRRLATRAPTLYPPRKTVTSFLGEAEVPKERRAYFVRTLRTAIGGEFDAAGNEEVEIEASVGGEKRDVFKRTLNLPSGSLRQFDIAGPWLELRPAKSFDIGIQISDRDVTSWEVITTSEDPLSVTSEAFTDQETKHRVELETISLREGVLFKKSVAIHGAWIELGLIGAPRRDAKDAESRETVERIMKAIAHGEAPADSAGANALGQQLDAARAAALETAGRSTHTRLRRVLPRLGEATRTLSHLANDVGGLARVASRLSALAERVEGVTEPDRPVNLREEDLAPLAEAQSARLEEALALAKRAPPTTREELEELREAALAVAVRFDQYEDQAKRFPGSAPMQLVNKALSDLLTTVSRAIRGIGKLASLKRGFNKLQDEVLAEISK